MRLLSLSEASIKPRTSLSNIVRMGYGISTPPPRSHGSTGEILVPLRPGLVYIEAGEKRTAVTHDHLVHTADGVVPARFLTAGAALAANETVTRIWSDEADASVSLIYTKSGRIVADGIIVSSYEHWTDPWLSLDAYLLYLLKATHILESQPYKLYFRMESAFLDPIVHWLWPHA